ncbi:MAG: MotE family protein [Alphaproteobacteria bacterium]
MLIQKKKDLDDRDKEISKKEVQLRKFGKEVSDKTDTLEKIQKEIKLLLNEADESEKTRWEKLAKVYEEMKPKKAAKVLNVMEIPFLKNLMRSMNQRKLAPILSNMDVSKTKELMNAFAFERKDFYQS